MLRGISSDPRTSAWTFLNGLFPEDFRDGKRPIKAFGKRPVKVRKRPIKEEKRHTDANGLFLGIPPWWKAAPLKRPIKRSKTDPCFFKGERDLPRFPRFPPYRVRVADFQAVLQRVHGGASFKAEKKTHLAA